MHLSYQGINKKMKTSVQVLGVVILVIAIGGGLLFYTDVSSRIISKHYVIYTYNLVYCIFMLYEFSSDRLGNAVANIYDVDWWSYQVQQHSTSNLSRLHGPSLYEIDYFSVNVTKANFCALILFSSHFTDPNYHTSQKPA